MITSVPKSVKQTLIKSGIEGFTHEEYGTLVAWVDEMHGGELVFGEFYAKHAAAYKRGQADPIYKDTGALSQYNNVLVDFSLDKCKPDLAMRPYMKLKNKAGEELIIYSGMIQRSIGYIAYQNRNAFKPGTAWYAYIWEIIHHVYGNRYDNEYMK